ncbi:hypothetical protein BN1723_019205, partial [Verticillium longisporum]
LQGTHRGGPQLGGADQCQRRPCLVLPLHDVQPGRQERAELYDTVLHWLLVPHQREVSQRLLHWSEEVCRCLLHLGRHQEQLSKPHRLLGQRSRPRPSSLV